MPKKLNFLGGQQNYDPENGEYLPDLTNAQGEPVKGFKTFKKSDEEKNAFNEYNDKRTGKESAALKEQIEKNTDYKEIMEKYKSGDKSEETDAAYQKYTVQNDTLVEISKADNELEKAKEIVERAKATMNSPEYKELKQKVENGEADAKELDDYWKPKYEKDIAETVIENLNENEEIGKEIAVKDDVEIGKITKYSPLMRQADGTWKKDDTQQKRIKTLHNGLGIETKAQDKEHIYHEQVGKYRLIDVETGTTVGWAKDYEDALKKSQDQDFIGAINRAKKVFYEKHPELKEQPKEEKIDYNAKRMGKESKNLEKELEKAKKRVYKFMPDLPSKKAMVSEMESLLERFKSGNHPEEQLRTAKENIQKWQRSRELDTNELRDERLVYFQKMIEYMENNL